jgi:hypothetical protein
MNILSKLALILGIIGMAIGGFVLLISLLLPVVTDGRTSWEEAMLGIIPGAVFLVLSTVVALIGLILVVMRRKKVKTVAL